MTERTRAYRLNVAPPHKGGGDDGRADAQEAQEHNRQITETDDGRQSPPINGHHGGEQTDQPCSEPADHDTTALTSDRATVGGETASMNGVNGHHLNGAAEGETRQTNGHHRNGHADEDESGVLDQQPSPQMQAWLEDISAQESHETLGDQPSPEMQAWFNNISDDCVDDDETKAAPAVSAPVAMVNQQPSPAMQAWLNDIEEKPEITDEYEPIHAGGDEQPSPALHDWLSSMSDSDDSAGANSGDSVEKTPAAAPEVPSAAKPVSKPYAPVEVDPDDVVSTTPTAAFEILSDRPGAGSGAGSSAGSSDKPAAESAAGAESDDSSISRETIIVGRGDDEHQPTDLGSGQEAGAISGDYPGVGSGSRPGGESGKRAGTRRESSKHLNLVTPGYFNKNENREILTEDGNKGPLSGAVWSDFEIGDLLGEGGMATVYLARRRDNGHIVALKVLPSYLSNDEVSRQRFELEARTSQKLKSPHIVQVHSLGKYTNLLYFEMELVEGESLADLLERNQNEGVLCPIPKVIDYMEQSAEGLAEAARNEIVHRDIKPANLMLTNFGMIKIADFGIAKVMGNDAMTMTGIALGTPAYMSPEQGRADYIDHRADIYSLGVVCYELVANKVPFDAPTSDAMIYLHHFGEPELLTSIRDECPAGLQAIIFKCLHKEPDSRYENIEQLLVDLERVADGQEPEYAIFDGKVHTGGDEALRARGMKRTWWPMVTLVAAILLLVIGGYWWWDARRTHIAELRQRLEPLSQPLPIPQTARADLDELADYMGEEDPDVANGRAKLEDYDQLVRILRPFVVTKAHVVDQVMYEEASGVIGDFEGLVGRSHPVAEQSRGLLKEISDQIAHAREQLSALDGVEVATEQQQIDLVEDIAVVERLQGTEANGLQGWRTKLAESAIVLQNLREAAAALDAADMLPLLQQQVLAEQVVQLGELVDAQDQQLISWRAKLDRIQNAFARLYQRLGVLDEGEAVPLFTIDRTADDLATYGELVPADNADLLRWQNRVADSFALEEELGERLMVLDQKALNIELVEGVAGELDRYQALVGADNPQAAAWRERSDMLRRKATRLRTVLKELSENDELSLEEQRLLQSTIDEAAAIGVIAEAERARYQELVAQQQAMVAVLSQRLRVLDRPVVYDPEVEAVLSRYERLVSTEDEAGQRWRAKVEAVNRLRGLLDDLDEAAPIPADAEASLVELQTYIGSQNDLINRWVAKVDRVARLKGELKILDEPKPFPATIVQTLAFLTTEVGADEPDVARWQDKVDRVNALLETLNGVQYTFILPEDIADKLPELAQLIGEDAVVVLAAQRRIGELDPGQPSWAVDFGRDQYGLYADLPFSSTVEQRFRYVPPGRFEMGSPLHEADRDEDEQQHEVVLSRGWWMAETECTQDGWVALGGENDSFIENPEHPVERVSWRDVRDVLEAASRQMDGVELRLPTEAEWEYACRAGSVGRWPNINATDEGSLGTLAIFDREDLGRSSPVARTQPNALGLYDMLGNVWEWCADDYGPYATGAQRDPQGIEGRNQVVRGGSWIDQVPVLRNANRKDLSPRAASAYVGFRIVISAEGELP